MSETALILCVIMLAITLMAAVAASTFNKEARNLVELSRKRWNDAETIRQLNDLEAKDLHRTARNLERQVKDLESKYVIEAEKLDEARMLAISPRGPWTLEDQAAFKTFWASDTGKHLRDQLTYSEAHRFTDAVYGKGEESTELLRGKALGYQRLLQDLNTLATGPAYDPDLAKAAAEPSAQA